MKKSELRQMIKEEIQKLNEAKSAVYFESPIKKFMDWEDKHKSDLLKLNNGKYTYSRMVLGSGNKAEIWMNDEKSAKAVYMMMNKGGLNPMGVGERYGFVKAASYSKEDMIDKFLR